MPMIDDDIIYEYNKTKNITKTAKKFGISFAKTKNILIKNGSIEFNPLYGKNQLPPKLQCERCGDKKNGTLEHHHIIQRKDGGTDDYWNVVVICSSCHSMHHHGTLNIIGVYPSNKLPYGRSLIYEIDGVKNFDISEPYLKPKESYGREQDSSGRGNPGNKQTIYQKDQQESTDGKKYP